VSKSDETQAGPSASRSLAHGGRLRQAATRYGIPASDWLDLSTGINPLGWPVPPAIAGDSALWSRLPEDEDGLVAAAADYYAPGHGTAILPVAGSQAAIVGLPQLRPPGRVGILDPTYAEHAQAWSRAGHEVLRLDPRAIEAALPGLDALVLVHPNNPTGWRLPRDTLLGWQARLAARGGWLVLDEAFMDATPEGSLVPVLPLPGLIVLRSLGKFFGLAGARVGFALGEPGSIEALADRLGPWGIANPARAVAAAALADRAWQSETRERLAELGPRLELLLRGYGLDPAGGCGLFRWVPSERAAAIHERLAQLGILTRLFERPASLRFGLPGAETEWARLDSALAAIGADTHR
jgi:cobalamin biosynthesis protein CobC